MESKNIHNKKGLMTFNMVNMIPRLIFLVLVLVTFFLALGMLLKGQPATEDLESDLLTMNMLYSTNGISYFNPETNRPQPGIIDLENFKSGKVEERINKEFFYGQENKHLAAKITLLDYNGNELSEIYYNKGEGHTYGFSYWAPLAEREGKGTPNYYIRSMPVLIRDKTSTSTDLYSGNVVIEVVMP